LNGDEFPGIQRRTTLLALLSLVSPVCNNPLRRLANKRRLLSASGQHLASGEKGPTGITHEGKSPVKANWFSGALPPGIDTVYPQDDKNAFFCYNDSSDHIRKDLFLDMCQNKLLPFHRKHIPVPCFGERACPVVVPVVKQPGSQITPWWL